MDIRDIGALDRQLFEELLKVSRQAKREDRELGEAMERLVRSADYQMFLQRVLGPRLEAFGSMVLEPANGEAGAWRTEFLKGALYAFCLTRDLPRVIIASMNTNASEENSNAS